MDGSKVFADNEKEMETLIQKKKRKKEYTARI